MRQNIAIISRFLTLLILMGTSLNSLGFDGVYTKLDSNKAFLVDGESSTILISTPTSAMYRRADREIAINMNEEINSVLKKKTASGSVLRADMDMNYAFYNQFKIHSFQLPTEQENEVVCQLFKAENIQFSTSFKSTDETIHGQFMHQHRL